MFSNRRSFLRQTAITTLGAGILQAVPIEVLASLRRQVSPNATINVALIGCKGQGWSNLTSMLKIPEVKCVALCDVDQNILAQRKADLEKLGMKPDLYGDYRKLLERKDVEAVIIATPDHWHCLQMVDAVSAGKDVFVEKPAANSVREAQLMLAAARRTGRVVQVNQWQRSQEHFKNAVQFVQSGKLGKITLAKTWMYRTGTTPLPPVPNEAVPAGVDYNMWLGPAEKRPFNRNRFHYEFRWFWDYAGGLMTDWGVHLIDMVLMGMKAEVPRSVMALGGKIMFPADARETPDTQTVAYDYGNFMMTWEHSMGAGLGLFGLNHGIAFFGEAGTLVLNRGGWEVKPAIVKNEPKMQAVEWQKQSDNGLDKHTVNFVEVLRSRNLQQLACPIEAGVRVAVNAHMGNIAQRTGEKIFWNAEKNEFTAAKANKLAVPEYHNGWKLPKETLVM